MTQVVTGYLPSVILMLFLYIVPPTMMLFSSIEGPISYSARKKSACCKVLYFTIWNVFFANVFSGSIISQINAISVPKDIPNQLAKAVPRQVINNNLLNDHSFERYSTCKINIFFILFVLDSGDFLHHLCVDVRLGKSIIRNCATLPPCFQLNKETHLQDQS